LPHPANVDDARLAGARSLAEKLQQETASLTQQNQDKKQLLAQQAAERKVKHKAQAEQRLATEHHAIDQRKRYQLMQLKVQMEAQKLAIEKQALKQKYDYQMLVNERRDSDAQRPEDTMTIAERKRAIESSFAADWRDLDLKNAAVIQGIVSGGTDVVSINL